MTNVRLLRQIELVFLLVTLYSWFLFITSHYLDVTFGYLIGTTR